MLLPSLPVGLSSSEFFLSSDCSPSPASFPVSVACPLSPPLLPLEPRTAQSPAADLGRGRQQPGVGREELEEGREEPGEGRGELEEGRQRVEEGRERLGEGRDPARVSTSATPQHRWPMSM